MSGFLQTCRADLQAAARARQIRPREALLLPGVWAVFTFRAGNVLHDRGLRLPSRLLWLANTILFGCELQMGADVGPGLVLFQPAGSGFGPGARLGRDVLIMGGVRLGAGGYEDQAADGFPTVGDGCRLLDGAKLFGPVTVGAGAVIGVNAVVTQDVPAGGRVEGSPARLVKRP
jgi:serine O-acetyltransferase